MGKWECLWAEGRETSNKHRPCSLPWATHVPTWTPTCDPAIHVCKTRTRYVCLCLPHMSVHGIHEYTQPCSNVCGQCAQGRPLWIHACGTCGNTPLRYVHAALLSSSSHPSLGQPQNPSHSSQTDSQIPALLSGVKFVFFFFFLPFCVACVKEIATHSNILAWRIPWTEEPGRLWSIQSQRVRHD